MGNVLAKTMLEDDNAMLVKMVSKNIQTALLALVILRGQMENRAVILVNVTAKIMLKVCLVIIAWITILDSLTAKHVNVMLKALMV